MYCQSSSRTRAERRPTKVPARGSSIQQLRKPRSEAGTRSRIITTTLFTSFAGGLGVGAGQIECATLDLAFVGVPEFEPALVGLVAVLVVDLWGHIECLLDVGDDAFEQLFFDEGVAHPEAHFPVELDATLRHSVEGYGDGDLCFVEVGHVVDKAEHGAGVDEADGGGEPRGEDGCMADAVEAGVGDAQSLIDEVGVLPGTALVVSS